MNRREGKWNRFHFSFEEVSWSNHWRTVGHNHSEMSGELVKEEGKKKKVALITGITGQDGSYLAELLLSKVMYCE